MKVKCNYACEDCKDCPHAKPHEPMDFGLDGKCSTWETRCPVNGLFVICVEVKQ